MSEQSNFLAREYVRTFSGGLRGINEADGGDTSPRERLESALKDEVERQDALTALLQQAVSRPETSLELRERFKQLETTVANFNQAFPQVGKENGSSNSLSWTALRQTMIQLQTKHDPASRKGFSGKSKKHFHSVCDTINNHMGVLKILPQGDKYTAPITGTLELIVKASVNHERIGQDFAAALEEIDDIVRAVRRDLLLYAPKFMISLGVQLCCKILDFIAIPLRWHLQKSRNRLLASFNENLTSNYQSEIAKIRRLSDEIARGKRHCSEVEVKGIGHNIADMKSWFDDVRLLLQQGIERNDEQWARFHRATEEQNRRLREDPVRLFAEMSQMFMPRPGDGIGVPMKQMIDSEAQHFAANAIMVQMPQISLKEPVSVSRDPSPRPQPTGNRYVQGVDVENGSQCLNAFFDLERIKSQDIEEEVFLEGEVAQRLQTWTAQTESSILCVLGPATLSSVDTAQLLTSNYIQAAKSAGIPCITYFCAVTHDAPTPPRTRETVGLVGLMYGLLKQLTLHLPENLPSEPVFSGDRFDNLDGTLRTWPQALTLLRDLITVAAPPYLLIAIHGVEILEHDATVSRLQSFVDILRQLAGSRTENLPKLKVLFATSGMSQVLGEMLNEDEICDISRGSAGRRPGRSGKGRQKLGELAFSDE